MDSNVVTSSIECVIWLGLQDEHASSNAKRATAAHTASKENVKSDAVKAAMERRAAAQLAAARKGKR